MKQDNGAFEPLAFEMGKPRVDLTKAGSLAAQLEDDELTGRYQRRRPPGPLISTRRPLRRESDD